MVRKFFNLEDGVNTNRSEDQAHEDPRPVCREPERAPEKKPWLSRSEKRAIKQRQMAMFEGVK